MLKENRREGLSMEQLLALALFILGLVLIVKGGDLFVDAAVWLAERTGMPHLLVGATIVSVATTLPEQLVSFLSAAQGRTDMAIGNAVGSVSANTGLILAVSILLLPAALPRRELVIRGGLMTLSALALLFLCRGGLLVSEGLILLGIFALFLGSSIRTALRNAGGNAAQNAAASGAALPKILAFLVGAAALAVGSELLVDNGARLAAWLGVPERIISVTLIAVGTSLPELVTAVSAIAKKQSSLSVGNILGANLLDLTLILPVCALLSHGTLPVSRESLLLDLPFCAGEAILATVPTLILRRFTRLQGAAMLGLYFAYIFFTFHL